MPLSLPIVTERLILRLPLLAGMFPKIADADDFDDYMHEHPDLWQLFKNDLDTQKFYEITSQDRFYFSGFRRSGIDANGCKYSEFRDVCEFVWGLCRDLERNPVSGYGLVIINKSVHEPCGQVRLYGIDTDKREAKRSVFVDPRLGRQGISKEAMMELSYAGFKQLGLSRILMRVDPKNNPSVQNIKTIFQGRFIGEVEACVPAEEGLRLRHLYALDRNHFLDSIYTRYRSAISFEGQLSQNFLMAAQDLGARDFHQPYLSL